MCECGRTTDLIEFKDGNKKFYICQRCWDEKLEKGIKNHNSFVNRCKEFKPSPKTGRS